MAYRSSTDDLSFYFNTSGGYVNGQTITKMALSHLAIPIIGAGVYIGVASYGFRASLLARRVYTAQRLLSSRSVSLNVLPKHYQLISRFIYKQSRLNGMGKNAAYMKARELTASLYSSVSTYQLIDHLVGWDNIMEGWDNIKERFFYELRPFGEENFSHLGEYDDISLLRDSNVSGGGDVWDKIIERVTFFPEGINFESTLFPENDGTDSGSENTPHGEEDGNARYERDPVEPTETDGGGGGGAVPEGDVISDIPAMTM